MPSRMKAPRNGPCSIRLKLQTGTVPVPAAHATLALQPGYSFLSAGDAQKVLTDLWGNPPDKEVLGMIVPGENNLGAGRRKYRAVVVTYSDDGHVKDDDASSIDYDDLLKDMKKGTEESSAERVKEGYSAIELGAGPRRRTTMPPRTSCTGHVT